MQTAKQQLLQRADLDPPLGPHAEPFLLPCPGLHVAPACLKEKANTMPPQACMGQQVNAGVVLDMKGFAKKRVLRKNHRLTLKISKVFCAAPVWLTGYPATLVS